MIEKKYSWSRDLILLTVVLSVFFSLFLGSRPLNTPDEGRYSEISREMLQSGDYITPRVNGVKFLDKPPLFFWVQASAIKVFGINEWSLRSAPAFFAVLGCLFIFIAGRSCFDRRTGFIAAAILATCPIYFFTGHYVSTDMAVATFITGSFCCFLMAIHAESERRQQNLLLGLAVSAALATLTKGLIGLVIPGMVILLWSLWWGDWFWLRLRVLGLGSVIYMGLTLPWYYLAERASPGFLHYMFVFNHFQRYVGSHFNNRFPVWFYIPLFIVTSLPWVLWLIPSLKGVMRDRLLSFLVLATAFVLVFFSIPQSKIVSYILPAFPPFALLIARYFAVSPFPRTQVPINVLIGTSLFAGITLIIMALGFMDKLQVAYPDWSAWYLGILGGALLGNALGLLTQFKKKGNSKPTSVLLASAFILVLLVKAIPSFIDTSIKPLALSLKANQVSGNQIYCYNTYFHDLPVYLQDTINVVDDWRWETVNSDNWKKDFMNGARFETNTPQLVSEADFWQRWVGPTQLFAVIDKRNIERASKHHKLYPIQSTHRAVLFTNHEIKNYETH
jgi:hypothetical protein